MEDPSQRIKVAVRLRPLMDKEIAEDNPMVWKSEPPNLIELEDDGRTPSTARETSWSFDAVFEPSPRTELLFDQLGSDIVEGALDGVNGTFIAFGGVGTGKTYTLMGSPESHPGVIPLSISKVFQWIEDHPEKEFDIKISFMEIYNEIVVDILDSDEKICRNKKIIEEKHFGPTVKDLVEVRVASRQQCLDTLAEAEARRDKYSDMSRVFTIFRMRIESRPVDKDEQSERNITIRNLANTLLKAQQAIGADSASLYVVDPDSGDLHVKAGDGTVRIPRDQGVAGACATTGERIIIPDASKDERVSPHNGYAVKSMLCLPIQSADGILGVVQFINKMPEGEFSEADADAISDSVKRLGELVKAAQSNPITTTMGCLTFVDMAGSDSEKARDVPPGEVLKEASYLNKSLMSFCTCIYTLSERKGSHVPYRNSVLTRLLSASIGGNARTCIICTISPALKQRTETSRTLSFSKRAREVATKAGKNTREDQGYLLVVLERDIEKLKREMEEAKRPVPPPEISSIAVEDGAGGVPRGGGPSGGEKRTNNKLCGCRFWRL